MSILTFNDVLSGQAPLRLGPVKGKVVRAQQAVAALLWGQGATYFPPQKILVVITRLDLLQRERESH